MNKENLDKIINNYINDISNLYNTDHDELFKWRAVKHFQSNWDIDAENFSNMLKEATKETSVLIDNSSTQPLNGLIKVAEKEPQVVKEMFIKLNNCNHKPVHERQLVIDECLKSMNEKIKEYFGDSWKYKQEKRTIIYYMTMMNPDDNYFYKSTEAMDMARCIEYADLSNGSNFKLESYYKMCDQIRNHILKREDLISVHNSYLTDECWEDKNLHILVFNIIYSAHAYGYYKKNDIVLTKKSLSTKDQKKKEAIEAKEKDEEELIKNRKELASITDYLENLDEIFEIGLEINHRKFGRGIVVNQTEEMIEVKFDNGEIKKLAVPNVFSGPTPIATTQEKSVIEECKIIEQKKEEKKILESRIKVLEFNIDNYDKIINA